jgi:hypothetical protein
MKLPLPLALLPVVTGHAGWPRRRSRVVYQPEQAGPSVWVQLSDGSCRWTQSAGEVLVQVLRVPPRLPARQLLVQLDLYSVHGGEPAGLPSARGASAALQSCTTCCSGSAALDAPGPCLLPRAPQWPTAPAARCT